MKGLGSNWNVFDNSGVALVTSITTFSSWKSDVVFKAVVKKVKKGSAYKKGDIIWVQKISQKNNSSFFRNFNSIVVVLNGKKDFFYRLAKPCNLSSFVKKPEFKKISSFYFL